MIVLTNIVVKIFIISFRYITKNYIRDCSYPEAALPFP